MREETADGSTKPKPEIVFAKTVRCDRAIVLEGLDSGLSVTAYWFAAVSEL